MPTVGSVKAQITEAANALRTLADAIPPSNINTGMDPTEIRKQKTTAATTMYHVQHIDPARRTVGKGGEYASKQIASDGEPGNLHEFRAHWEANACDQIVERAED
ncbi:unnamed protein product [Heligmosomoides polygyrus]|uniref:Tox-GHH domain-containing protein n=1 Tax=Heligmosomoides polygyrus TaxID=6339 RepID=A0A183GIX6_HELPZ|nr:unnamed protein product [Heligmosomoides polygyrus]